VQFATANAVYLLQVQQQDLSGAVREILSSEKIVKVGVSVSDDMLNLKKLFPSTKDRSWISARWRSAMVSSRLAYGISPGYFSAHESPRARRRRTGPRAA
jgi:hypothetical protein